MTERDPIYAEANARVKVEDLAGVKLARVGFRLRGQCPVCKAGEGKLKDGPFWIDPDAGKWGCFAERTPSCAEGGDAVALERAMRGGSPREAAERIVGPGWQAPQSAEIVGRHAPAGRKSAAEVDEKMAMFSARLLREARPARMGSLVDVYLAARGIGEAVRSVIVPELKLHPECPWGDWRGRHVSPPAMMAPVRTVAGRTGGAHATFLMRDGSGKARLAPAKKMLGPQKGVGGPGGALLSPLGDDWAGRPLIVGEGIETTASAAELHWRETGVVPRMAAALSLGRLQGGWLCDDRGRYDIETPRADPEDLGFTLPDAGEVWIAVDRDMKPVDVATRGPGGRKVTVELDADARARVCGSLAEQHWTAAGANRVRTIAPRAGMDFNDHLRGL